MTLIATAHAWSAPLAQVWARVPPGDYDPSSGHGPEWGKAAPAGLLIWLFMGVALFLLIKSMNRNLRKVPKNPNGTPASDLVASRSGWVPRDKGAAAAAGEHEDAPADEDDSPPPPPG